MLSPFSIIMLLTCSILTSNDSTKYKQNDHIALRIGKIYADENPLKHANFIDLGFCTGNGKELFKSNTIANSIFGIFYVESRMIIKFNENTENLTFCHGSLKFEEIRSFLGSSKNLFYDIVLDGIQKSSKIASVIEDGIIHVNTHRDVEIFINNNEIVDFNIQDKLLYPIKQDKTDIDFMYSIKFTTTKEKRHLLMEKVHDHSVRYTVISLVLIYLIAYFCFRHRIIAKLNDFGTLRKTNDNNDDEFDNNFLITASDRLFVPPVASLLLSSLIGSGIQVFFAYMIASILSITLSFSSLDSTLPFFKDILIAYAISSFFNGYVSSNIYLFFNGTAHYYQAFISSLVLPLFFISSLISLSTNFATTDSLYLLDLRSISALALFYAVISLPMTLLGNLYARKNTKKLYSSLNYRNIDKKKLKYPKMICSRMILIITYHAFTLTPLLFQIYFVYKTKWLDSYLNINIGLRLLIILIIISALMMLISLIYSYKIIEAGRYLWQWESFGFGFSIFITLEAFSLAFLRNNLAASADILTVHYFLSTTFMWSLALALYSGALSFLSACFIVGLIKRN